MAHFVFGSRSRSSLETVDESLRTVLTLALALTPIDFVVIQGHRNEVDQNAAVTAGTSQVRFPNSKHNSLPSKAVDIALWRNGEINFKDTGAFILLAGVVFAAAQILGVEIRWGGDWDVDGDQTDERFRDLGHFELV